MIHTLQTLRDIGDPSHTHVWVKLKQPVKGRLRGRLVGIGRKYCRIMFGNEIVRCLPDAISFVTTGVNLP